MTIYTYTFTAAYLRDSLAPFQAEAGGTIELLDMGTVSAVAMFKAAELRNKYLTWALRFAVTLIFPK